MWTGPDGSEYDFFAGGQALEVKTTLRRQGIILTIHGHDQLDTPQGGNLHVAVLLIEETPVRGRKPAISQLKPFPIRCEPHGSTRNWHIWDLRRNPITA